MTLSRTLTQLQATHCPDCNGHGYTRGVFHAFECDRCAGVGYVLAHGGHRLDRLAVGVIRRRLAAQKKEAAAARWKCSGTPDNWELVGNFRGD